MIVQQHKEGLKFYIDFHAHAGKRGSFFFGNSLTGQEQVENIIFAKLVSLNSVNFDFAECSFAEQIMTAKDRRDGASREGSSRVAIYKETGLVNCYTLECNYHNAKRYHCIPPRMDIRTKNIIPETPITDVNSELYEGKVPPAYTLEHFKDIGRAVGLGLLDYYELNPISRIPMSIYKTLKNLRKEIAIKAPAMSKRLEGKFAKKNKCKNNKQNNGEVSIMLVLKDKGKTEIYEIVDSEESTQKKFVQGESVEKNVEEAKTNV